jgi:hypothetical protein
LKSLRLFRLAKVLLFGFLLAAAETIESQELPRLQVQFLGLSGTKFIGAGLGYSRPLSSRMDLAGSATLGAEAGRSRLRIEGVALFHLNRVQSVGWGLYGGAGLAVHELDGVGRQYLLVLLGIEQNSREGPFLEFGVGGGGRVGIGYRVAVGG